MKKLLVALLLYLGIHSGSGIADHIPNTLTCINPSVQSIVFGAQCPIDFFQPDPNDGFDYGALEDAFTLPPFTGDPVICDPITLVQINDFTCGPNPSFVPITGPLAPPPWDFYTNQARAPEPSILGLLGIGVLGLLLARRKRPVRAVAL